MKEITARFWIAEKPEEGKEIPRDLRAKASDSMYQLVMGYRDEVLARDDMREIARRSSESELVLLRFDVEKKVFDVLGGSKASDTLRKAAFAL